MSGGASDPALLSLHGVRVLGAPSTAQVADKILLLARTTPLEEVKRPTEGLSLFYTDFDRSRITAREIDKMGRKAIDSNQSERGLHWPTPAPDT